MNANDLIDLKDAIKEHFIQSIILWILIWICGCFIIWDFYHPLYWVTTIPEWGVLERVCFLIGFLGYTAFSIGTRFDNKRYNRTNKTIQR